MGKNEGEGEVRTISNFQYFLSGGFGGICSVFSGHPLDTIKVRLQTMPPSAPGTPPMYTSTLDCARKTIKYEGVRGLYKGMGAPLTGAAPVFAISFLGYSFGKDLVGMGKDRKLTNAELFMSGMFAGVFTVAVMAPGERIKTLIQVQQGGGPRKYSGPIDVIKQLYKMGGIKSIYKGTVATMLRDVPGSGMYFMTYECLKDVMVTENQTPGLALLSTLAAGGMAGVSYWLVGTPPDVIKSRLQSATDSRYPKGIYSVFKELIAEGGPAALYKGVTPVMIRAFVANAACFVGYEFANKCINWTMDQLHKYL